MRRAGVTLAVHYTELHEQGLLLWSVLARMLSKPGAHFELQVTTLGKLRQASKGKVIMISTALGLEVGDEMGFSM